MSYVEPTFLQCVGEYFDGLLWKGVNLYFDVLGIPRVAVTELPTETSTDQSRQR